MNVPVQLSLPIVRNQIDGTPFSSPSTLWPGLRGADFAHCEDLSTRLVYQIPWLSCMALQASVPMQFPCGPERQLTECLQGTDIGPAKLPSIFAYEPVHKSWWRLPTPDPYESITRQRSGTTSHKTRSIAIPMAGSLRQEHRPAPFACLVTARLVQATACQEEPLKVSRFQWNIRRDWGIGDGR